MAAYVILMLLILFFPVLIETPCVCDVSDLPPRPKLFAHRGASAVSESLAADLV